MDLRDEALRFLISNGLFNGFDIPYRIIQTPISQIIAVYAQCNYQLLKLFAHNNSKVMGLDSQGPEWAAQFGLAERRVNWSDWSR